MFTYWSNYDKTQKRKTRDSRTQPKDPISYFFWKRINDKDEEIKNVGKFWVFWESETIVFRRLERDLSDVWSLVHNYVSL